MGRKFFIMVTIFCAIFFGAIFSVFIFFRKIKFGRKHSFKDEEISESKPKELKSSEIKEINKEDNKDNIVDEKSQSWGEVNFK